jgi:large subunit ribosomal protein L29|tara:strand:+ start:318 stop:620 length:303 start_codon:yes stop_codon:yes gene_type:complete
MKIKELRSMDKSTINEKVLELKKELVKMNAQVAIGTALKNPGQIRVVKKTLARILTVGNEKSGESNIKKDLKKTNDHEVSENSKSSVPLRKKNSEVGKQA